jgi:F0F1-type ATP synthase membrane subunit a
MNEQKDMWYMGLLGSLWGLFLYMSFTDTALGEFVEEHNLRNTISLFFLIVLTEAITRLKKFVTEALRERRIPVNFNLGGITLIFLIPITELAISFVLSPEELQNGIYAMPMCFLILYLRPPVKWVSKSMGRLEERSKYINQASS